MSEQRGKQRSPDQDHEAIRTFHPRARTITDVSLCEFGDGDVTLLDPGKLEYHTLNRAAYNTWMLCDGNRSLEDVAVVQYGEIATESQVALVQLAVLELAQAGLLENDHDSHDNDVTTRRRLMQIAAAALVGGFVAPAVLSVTAPDSASAVSRCGDRPNTAPCDTVSGCTSCCCCGIDPNNPGGSCAEPAVCAQAGKLCV